MRRPKANPILNVLHLTDPHLFADEQDELRGTNTAQSLDAVISDYSDADWSADFVIVSGDIVQDDSAGAYRHFRRRLEALGVPVLVCPGNHDVPALMEAELAEAPFAICETTRVGAWTVIGLSTYEDGTAGGRLAERELKRLEKAADTDNPVLVFLHHPPLDLGSRWLDSVGLSNKEEFVAAITRLDQVRCVLFGHAHQDVETDIGGVTVLGTPSTCRQFKPKSDTFAVDDTPPAYRRLTLHDDGAIEHTLHWVTE